MDPLLSIIIPTRGRDTLARALKSVRDQWASDAAEVIVIEDTHCGTSPKVPQVAEQYGARYLALDAGHHCWGHCQINEAMRHARGALLSFQDDDDIYTPGALDAIADAANAAGAAVPMLFQFRSYHGHIWWQEPYPVQGRIGGHCIVAPNVPASLGTWGCRYEGDYDFIVSTLAHYGDVRTMWIPRIISHARPGAQ